MAEAFIVRRGGGGGSGGTLVVTSSGAGTVTVSNSTLGKSYSKTVTAGGSVTFKGLKTGDWTVTVSNGTQTATRSVTINADYSVSVAYFSATISVTYPAKSTCVVTNSSGQTVASNTNTGSSTKTWTATVNATGAYTVTATATDGSGKSKSTTVSITADGQSKSVTLTYQIFAFSANNQHTDITGGWVSGGKTGHATITIGQTLKIVFDSATGNGAYINTKNMVDISPYSKIRFKGYSVDPQYAAFGVSKNLAENMGYDPGSTYTAYIRPETSNADKYVDVSSLSGNYYIVVSAYHGTSANAAPVCYEVELIE